MIEAPFGGVTVRRVEHLPETLDGAARVGPYSVARPGALLRVVPGVGRFLARDGTTLEFMTEPNADEAAVNALLEGGVLGALMHQRGELPLHATTLVSPDATLAIALAGHSGAGKSTTAYELTRRGSMLLSDDLTRVTIENFVPIAWPGRSRLRLMSDACDAFDLDATRLAGAPNWPDKYVVDLARANDPMPLAALVALSRTDGPLDVEILGGAAKVRTLAEQTYRLHYVAALGQTPRHFELVTAMAASVMVIRTSGRASVSDVADAILATVNNR